VRTIEFEDHVAHELTRASFVLQRRWLPWSTGLLLLLTVVGAMASLLGGASWWLAAGGGLLSLVSGLVWGYYEWAYRSQRSLRAQLRAGLAGQQLLPKILSSLDDGYYLLNNLKLPGRADDVDHLIIGPNGIFALEAKHHRGRIFWKEGHWYQSKMSRRGLPQPESELRDPIQQLKRNVDYLRGCINGTDRDLSRRTRLWIEGAVVFTHPAVSLDLPDDVLARLPFQVLHARDVPTYIQQHEPRQRLSKSEVRQIASMFGHLQQPGCPPEDSDTP
jgi:hypothetical protein